MTTNSNGGDDIGAATRALADAVSALTKSVTRNITDVGQDVHQQMAGSLRAASRELSEASLLFVLPRTVPRVRAAKADRTRSALIEAAKKLFAERGYEAASLGDVAAEAGFTKGAVYANFASKEELLLEVVKEVAAENQRWLATNGERPTVEALTEPDEDGQLSSDQLLGIEIALYAARHPNVRQAVADALSPGITGLAGLIAAERGEDPDQPGPDDLDTALGLAAVRAYAPVIAVSIGEADAAQTTNRLIKRLIETRK